MKPSAGARPPAIFVMGPTAAGKTDFAVEAVEQLECEIVSVDSAMVYRGLDIGTAKPDAATLARAPHRLIDICEPSEAYSVARFRDDALAAMAEITATGRVPLLVGGTMLYFRALEQGLAELPGADPAVREGLEQALREQGLAALHRRLVAVDPKAAARIHPNDPQRTLRALEVWELTGRPLSALQAEQTATDLPYRVLKLVCIPAERAVLRERIAARFVAMLERGLVAEVAGLLARPDVTPELPALRTVGYRQVAGYLAGAYDRQEMTRRGIAATRQLAKRQMTWLRSATALLQFDPGDRTARRAALRWLCDRLPGTVT
jgi:tRNA dimethylallyltransferase